MQGVMVKAFAKITSKNFNKSDAKKASLMCSIDNPKNRVKLVSGSKKRESYQQHGNERASSTLT